MNSDLPRVPAVRAMSSIRKVCLSGAPAHFISVSGRVKSPVPPSSVKRLAAFHVRGIVGSGIERAEPVFTDHIEAEAVDGVMVEHKAGGDDEPVIGKARPA